MSGIISKQIKNKNILFYFDAANTKSYAGTGSTGYSLVLGTTASLLAGVTWSSANGGAMAFNGKFANALSAYTADSWMTCGDRIPKIAPSFPITLEAWIRPAATGLVDTPVTYGVFNLDATEQFVSASPLSFYYGIGLDITSNDGTNTHNISCGYYNGIDYGSNARKSVSSASRVVKSGEWSHIAAVVSNSTTFALYYNGEAVPMAIPTGTANTMVWSGGIGKTVIGKPAGYYKYLFKGDIAMARAYNLAFSAADIKENYNLHATRFGLAIK